MTTDAPALALPIALGLPRLRLEYPNAERLAEVYALTLDSVLLPFSSITCRRDSSGLALTVTIPSASAALLAIVSAHETGTIRVLRGPRLPDGTLQLDELLTATLDTWAWRAGVQTGEITLSASAATATATAQSRTLSFLSYTNSDRGIRQVRSRVDTYLKPGDIALLGGGQSLAVTNITYNIQPDQGAMDVQGI